jgi:CheY-like chemotaxis protein
MQSSPLEGTVLVVDDEPDVLAVAEDMVRQMGLKVMVARDGVEAMLVFREYAQEIDLVLLDLTMPRMDGNETFQAIRKLDSDLPVFIASGFAGSTVIEATCGKPIAGIIQKPYSYDDLKRALFSSNARKARPAADLQFLAGLEG